MKYVEGIRWKLTLTSSPKATIQATNIAKSKGKAKKEYLRGGIKTSEKNMAIPAIEIAYTTRPLLWAWAWPT